MFSTYLSYKMGPGPAPTPSPGLGSQAGLWGSKAGAFSGLAGLPGEARAGVAALYPSAPDLRWWEVLLLEGGTWGKAVPPGFLS